MKLRWLLILLIPFACSPIEEDQNKEIATKMFQAFNDHDWIKMTTYYSSDAMYLDPAYGLEFTTKSQNEIVEKYSAMEQTFPDIHDSITSIYAMGNKVTVEFISTGSSGDSIKFTLPICTVLTFQNGKIVRDATYYDNN
jgi:ketosteroid isomerase-like protein